jgi:2-oxoglutarate ferredoxin oxidoreductase subunit alpha
MTVLATNLAERFQGPVYIALDQALAQDAATVPRFDLDSVTVDRGSMVGAAELSVLREYRRYALNGHRDGISPWVPVGTPGGQHLVTGNEHDEWGLVSTLPANRVQMVEKRARKLEAIRSSLPRARPFGDAGADIALIGFGLDTGVMEEAAGRLAERGLPVRGLQVRTLWPVLEDVQQAISECRHAYLVEHNASGQYAQVLASQGIPAGHLHSVLRYDGLAFRPAELVDEILRREIA